MTTHIEVDLPDDAAARLLTILCDPGECQRVLGVYEALDVARMNLEAARSAVRVRKAGRVA